MHDEGVPPFEDRFAVFGLAPEFADYMIEQIVGLLYDLPKAGPMSLSITGRLQVYGRPCLVSMVVVMDQDRQNGTSQRGTIPDATAREQTSAID